MTLDLKTLNQKIKNKIKEAEARVEQNFLKKYLTEIYIEEFKKFTIGTIICETVDYKHVKYVNTFVIVNNVTTTEFEWHFPLKHDSTPFNHIELMPLKVNGSSIFKNHWVNKLDGVKVDIMMPWALCMDKWELYKIRLNEDVFGRRIFILDSSFDLDRIKHLTNENQILNVE